MAKKRKENKEPKMPTQTPDAPTEVGGSKRNMINLKSPLYERLRDLAERNHRPLKWELELAVEAYLRAHEGGEP